MAKLTTKQRNALPKEKFAIPSKAPASGSYPIDTESRARNALARSSGKAEEATVRRKVAAKYPGITQKGKSPSGKSGGKSSKR